TSPPFALAAWWTGDDNPFDIWDSHHGSLQNGATYDNGKVGRAFSFDGVNDFVSIPHSPTWNFGFGDFSIDLWAKFDSIKNSMFIHREGKPDGPIEAGLQGNPGGWEFNYQVGTSELFFNLNPTIAAIHRPWSPKKNTWYHLAVTRNKGNFSLFVDGVQLGASEFVDSSVPNVFGGLKIGGYTLDGNYEMDGLIDEVEIIHSPLSSFELEALFNAGSAG